MGNAPFFQNGEVFHFNCSSLFTEHLFNMKEMFCDIELKILMVWWLTFHFTPKQGNFIFVHQEPHHVNRHTPKFGQMVASIRGTQSWYSVPARVRNQRTLLLERP